MALVATLTKMFPTENRVGIKLVLTDNDRSDLGTGAQVVINKTIQRQYVAGQGMANKARDEIGLEAQGLIDRYKTLKARFVNPVYDTKVAQIQTALNVD